MKGVLCWVGVGGGGGGGWVSDRDANSFFGFWLLAKWVKLREIIVTMTIVLTR